MLPFPHLTVFTETMACRSFAKPSMLETSRKAGVDEARVTSAGAEVQAPEKLRVHRHDDGTRGHEDGREGR